MCGRRILNLLTAEAGLLIPSMCLWYVSGILWHRRSRFVSIVVIAETALLFRGLVMCQGDTVVAKGHISNSCPGSRLILGGGS